LPVVGGPHRFCEPQAIIITGSTVLFKRNPSLTYNQFGLYCEGL
jgi:hypothetical protein